MICPDHPTQKDFVGEEYAKEIMSRHTGQFVHTRNASFFEDKPGLIYTAPVGCTVNVLIHKEN